MIFTSHPINERAPYLAHFTKITFGKYSTRQRRRSIAVFDIETADATLLGKPAGIALTSDVDFPNIVKINNDHENCMINFLKHFLTKRYRSFVAYAHKGMSFDVSHILGSEEVQQWLIKHGFTVHVDVSFAVIRRGKHNWYLGDSLRLIPEKLEKVLKSFAPHHTKAPLPNVPFSWRHEGWIKRITEDTLGLYESLKKVEEVVQTTFKVPISLTMPSTALRAARTMLPRESIARPARTTLDWIRAGAYSGGRIEVYWQGPINGDLYCFDVNSAYAWAMKQLFPLGKGHYSSSEPTNNDYYIARCQVEVPQTMNIPPILSRLFIHSFAVGNFQGMLTKEEVEFARQCGARVSYIEGWNWAETAHVFRSFIELCEELRAKDYQGPLGKTVKLMQNGLYGILGMNPFRRVQKLSEKHPGRPWIHAFDLTNGRYVENTYEAITFRESPNMMPHWAAIITARVRTLLSRYLLTFEKCGLQPLYAHTDSIWAAAPNGLPKTIQQMLSPEYGKLKLEHHGTRAIIVGPGEAALHGCQCKSCVEADNWHISSKGWRATGENFEQGEPIEIEQEQVFRAGTAMKHGSPGRRVHKIVLNYDSMSNRHIARKIPGATQARLAQQYDYDKYWSYASWETGKLITHPPNPEDCIIESQYAKQRRMLEKKHRISANRRAGQWRRMDREFFEGYEAHLREQAEYATLFPGSAIAALSNPTEGE